MSFVKIQSNQATISASQNLVDFEVPDYIQGLDLDESFININYRIDTTDAGGAPGVGVYNFAKLFRGIGPVSTDGDGGQVLFNSCLVRNIVMTASKAGQLESIQRADLYNQVRQQFTKNVADIQADGSHSLGSFPEEWNYPMDQSRNLITEGDVKSTEKEGVMRIPLKEVLGLGESTLNLSQLGSLRLHLEMNLNKFGLLTLPPVDSGSKNVLMPSDIQNTYYTQTIAIAIGQPAPAFLTFAGSPAPGPGGQLNGNLAFLSKKNCPFWVGMRVEVAGVGPGVTNAAVQRVISKIEFVKTALVPGAGANVPGGLVAQISFEGGLLAFVGNVAGGAVVAITMIPMKPLTAELKYTGAELVCKTVASPPQSKGLRYRTIETIQDFASATTSLNRTYEMPANAVGSLVCFDTQVNQTQFSNSFNPNLTSYQVNVDNVGMTDRRVNIKNVVPFVKDPLHGIMLEKTLEEMGLEYKNNLDVLPSQVWIDKAGSTANTTEAIQESQIFNVGPKGGKTNTGENVDRVTVLPVIYEPNGQRKLMNLSLEFDGASPAAPPANNLVMFQQVEREVNY